MPPLIYISKKPYLDRLLPGKIVPIYTSGMKARLANNSFYSGPDFNDNLAGLVNYVAQFSFGEGFSHGFAGGLWESQEQAQRTLDVAIRHFMGESFDDIRLQYGFSKARAHQIYNQAQDKLTEMAGMYARIQNKEPITQA